MIAGTLPTPPQRPFVDRFMMGLVVYGTILFMVLFFVGLLVVGILGIFDQLRGDQSRFADLWICFPPAVLILGAASVMAYGSYVQRQRTIQECRYEAGILEYRLPASAAFLRRELADISHLQKDVQQHATILSFRDGEQVILLDEVENAAALIQQISSDRFQ